MGSLISVSALNYSYDIGLIGRKHLNEISSGSKAFAGPTRRPTQKPIRTAPVTHVSEGGFISISSNTGEYITTACKNSFSVLTYYFQKRINFILFLRLLLSPTSWHVLVVQFRTVCVRYHVTVPDTLNAKDTMASTECVKEEKCSIHSRIFVITLEMSTVNQLKVNLNDLDYVHTMPAHFENGGKCDCSKIWARVHTIPEPFESSGKCDGSKLWARVHTIPAQFETIWNLTVKNSLQDFDAKEMYLHPKNRPGSFQRCRRKLFCLHHFRVFTRCCFKNVPAG